MVFRKSLLLILPICLIVMAVMGYAQTDITNSGGTITAQYTDSPSGEEIAKLVDNNTSTKYLTFHSSGWVQFKANTGAAVTSYTITSANDAADRDPKNFNLQGSSNGTSWTTLNSQSNQTFSARFQKKTYSFSNSTSYTYYRLNVTAVNGGSIMQMAEWELLTSGNNNGTPIVPYVQVNGGTWQQTSAASLAAGGTVKFGPQPITGGSWKWSGPNGYSAITREITISNIQTNQGGNYVATYTDASGGVSTCTFTITVSGNNGGTITPYVQINGGAWQQTTTASLAAGGTVKFGPQPTSGTWSWSGPNGFSSTSREVTISNIQTSQAGNYVATYNGSSTCTFTVTVTGNNNGDWSNFTAPSVTFTDNAGGLNGSTIFRNAVPNVTQMMRDLCLEVCQTIFTNNSDSRRPFNSLNLQLVNDPNGVAGSYGSDVDHWIDISAQYIESYYNSHSRSNAAVLTEVQGILTHEGTHCYQQGPYNCGSYDGSSVSWAYTEDFADGVRLTLHPWPNANPSTGGSWMNGYSTGGFFFRWCRQNKKSTFLIDINHCARDMSTFSFDGAFQQILGQSVQSVWNEYQTALKGSDEIIATTGAVNSLSKAYPNPFRAQTTISYSVKAPVNVSLVVYNALGQQVKSLVNESKNAGQYTVTWNGMNDDGSKVPAGVYFTKLNTGTATKTLKMVVID